MLISFQGNIVYVFTQLMNCNLFVCQNKFSSEIYKYEDQHEMQNRK